MRVISGNAKGTKLYSLEGLNTRPTLDRVKESLFNIINDKIYDAIVLDLFAGSGSLGIECASRGAFKVYFCDKSKQAINIVQKNIEKTKLEQKCNIINEDYKIALQKVNEKLDLIFIDPPYDSNLAYDAVKEVINLNKMKEDGIIVLETNDDKRIKKQLEEIDNIDIYDIRKYGKVYLIFISRKG